MAETSVPITAGSGTNIDGFALPDGKIQQAVAIGDGATNGRVAHVGSGGDLYSTLTSPNAAALGIFANINPYGSLRVTTEPSTLFMDPFDGVAVDVNRWTTGGNVAGSVANGGVSIVPTVGASVSNSTTLISVPTFLSPGVGFLVFSCTVVLEAAQTNAVNVHRFWGKGQVTSYTYATPVTDGVGFEVEGTTGALQCVVYVNGTKYVINSSTVANITSSLNGAVTGGTPAGTALPSGAVASAYGTPLTWQGGQHRYATMIRSDVVYWFVEGTEKPVAVLAYGSPNVQALPLRLAAITNPAGTSVANAFTTSGTAVNDATGGNTQISDGTYPHRKAKVETTGALDVNLSSSSSNQAQVSGTLTAAQPVQGTPVAGGTISASVGTQGNGTIVLFGGTYTSLTLLFEASIDNGTNWFYVDVTRADGSAVINGFTGEQFIATGVRAWNFIAPGYTNVRVRAAAFAATVNPSVIIAAGPFLYDPSPSVAPLDGNKPTYSTSLNATAVANAVTASVDLWSLINPTAGTRLVRVLRLSLQLTLATAGAVPLIELVKRSSVDTAGTIVAQTVTAHDSLSPVSVVTSNLYTAAPTSGTLVGTVRTARLFGNATVMTVQPNGVEWLFGNRPGQALVLRPGQCIGIMGQAAFGTAPTISGDVEWSEE